MSNHINEILFALTDAGVEFVVGGGVAAVLHGVERVTLDIDLALDMDPANVEKFLQVMHELGLQPRVPVPARDLMSREAVQRMIAEKGALVFSFVDFERALAQCKTEDFDGHTEFYRLTPEQRLEWLCQAATFVYEFKGKANPAR